MLEVVIPTLTFAAGTLVAWVFFSARARGQHAVLRERILSAEGQVASGVAQVESLSLRLREVADRQRTEVERRAAAEAVAQRVTALDAKVVDRERTIAEQGAELARLEPQLTAERKTADEKLAFDQCDFVEQPSRTHDGRLRPDLIVKLPGGKRIVVDAKAPIAAYLNAVEAQDEATQRARLADHARQVLTHITALGRKAYWEQFNPSPEFVVLFLPGETFFSAALNEDPALIEFGVNEMVIPATPTTLIALLRAVAYGWRQEALAQNAQDVAELGRLLYERITKLAEHWAEVGDRLGKAVDSYNRSVSRLESRVLVTARRLRDLKAAPEGAELERMEPVERVPRELQAVEFVSSSAAGAE